MATPTPDRKITHPVAAIVAFSILVLLLAASFYVR